MVLHTQKESDITAFFAEHLEFQELMTCLQEIGTDIEKLKKGFSK